MKLILAIVQAQDVNSCADALAAAGFVSTRVASHGGFLDGDNCTLMIGVDDGQVDEVCAILGRRAQHRVEMVEGSQALPGGALTPAAVSAMDVEVGGATVLVLPLERFEKL
ncbi:MAG: cyclic-di-AMP receptor [Candidatus Dormibacteraeota bacterium]|uniref:Cyclic-di-AMP receptor n=1 Tax=Candidatus Amunia macphersoniae TaxID=3127014 RepID=A0A934N921_9BACT|nr:cyclic-di-AMP receptor [Candidatus Dormibacteraeota bacterium]